MARVFSTINSRRIEATWTLSGAEIGEEVSLPEFPNKTIEVSSSNWGSASLAIEGSNLLVNYFPLDSLMGISLTGIVANALYGLLSGPKSIRPHTTGGTTEVVTVHMIATRQ